MPGRWIVRTLLAGTFVAVAQDAGEYYRRGTQLFDEHKPAAAIAALEQSVALKPEHAAAWKALGVVYAAQGDYEKAEKPFLNACQRQPALADACLYYGRTLYLLNRFRPAVEVLRRALENDKSNAQIYRLMALSWEGLGEATQAGAAFQAAVRLTERQAGKPVPLNEDPGIDYGVYLFRQGQAEPALGPLQSALERHPDAARAHLELGCVLLSLDRLEEAGAHLERAAALEPGSSRSHLLLGKVYLRLGKEAAGEEQLRQGLLQQGQGSRTVK
jgi:tetratricopeptide (TPR) repeat protein